MPTTRDPRLKPQFGDTIRIAEDHDADVRKGSVLRVVWLGEAEGLLMVRYWTDGDYPEGESDRCWWELEEWRRHTAGGEVME